MNDAQKILIVDDEENIRRIFKKALEQKNYTVHTAKNAEDALQKIKNQNYLLIFSDIFMDEMSGLTLLKEVKKINSQAKIVVMTAQDTMNNTIEAMRTGAYDYISKPFDFETVYALVDRVEASRKVQIPSRSKIEEENMRSTKKKSTDVKERDVCRIILDRNEVLASRISNLLIESAGKDLDEKQLRDLVSKIKAETVKSSNSTVDTIINLFSR